MENSTEHKLPFVTPEHPENIEELVEQTRKGVLAIYEADPDRYDFSIVEQYVYNSKQWPLITFLCQNNYSVDDAVENIVRTLEFYKSLDLHLLTDQIFPAEVHRIGAMFGPYEPDRWGHSTFYFRLRIYRPASWNREATKRFIMHKFTQVCFHSEGRGIALIADLSDSSIFNTDVPLLYFLIESYLRYSPHDIRYILLYNLPRLLSWAVVLLKTGLSSYSLANMIHIAHGDDLFKYIAPENVPPYLGGTCKRNYLKVPESCISIQKGSLSDKYTHKELQRVVKHYQKPLEDADIEEEQYFPEDLNPL